MEIQWISLVLVSATIHPIRELILKNANNPLASYLGVVVIWLILATSQNILFIHDFQLPTECMPLIFISALGLTLYYYGTLVAMEQGHLSIYYPIVRSSPIAIVIFSWLFLDAQYTDLTVIAIILIFFGAIMLQKSRFSFFGNKKALLFALMAMIGSAGYSLSDAVAVQQIKPSVLIFYCCIVLSLFLFVIFLVNTKDHQNALLLLFSQWKIDRYHIISAGIVSYCSYYLILIAFELGGDAAAVSAVRQASIPISVLLAAYFLRENETFRRLGWALLIAAGIIILSKSH